MAGTMQFWGIEVKGKESCKVHVEEGSVIHLSQATLGELKKDADPVILHVKVQDKRLVLGILTHGNNPQLAFDLVFDTDFEISHNWKNGSVHFLGYQSELHDDVLLAGATEEEFPDFSDDEEDVPVPQQNGKPSSAAAAAVAKAAAKLIKKSKAEPEEGSKDESDDSDEDEEDSDDDSEGAEDMMSLGEDDEDDSDDEESSDEEEPAKQAESGKKRSKSEAKTPVAKKAKLATPQKTADGKKGGHDATPHPSKKGGKTPGSNKSPKSGGQVSCGSCTKTFNSEVALQSHSKAKHASK